MVGRSAMAADAAADVPEPGKEPAVPVTEAETRTLRPIPLEVNII